VGPTDPSKSLTASIRTRINNWNDDPKPFIWHKTADEILDSVARRGRAGRPAREPTNTAALALCY
jgi:hypothetical protein